ncbi:dTMP kinase [Billgrantia azerbaijanica]|nr:dTMP kinase [Halomonas azerbaijanica]
MKGAFIVFEGIDGSGTSTQSALLRDYLVRKNLFCHLTSEPSPGPIGTLIRQGMSGRTLFSKGKLEEKFDLFDEQMAYLFSADRHDHLYNPVDGIVRLVEEGKIVISSRYYFSSLAYHCTTKEDFDFVYGLNRKFPPPDLLIYMDNDVQLSMSRIQNRASKDEYENQVKLERVKRNYQEIIEGYIGDKLVIDASKPIDKIHDSIVTEVEKKLWM